MENIGINDEDILFEKKMSQAVYLLFREILFPAYGIEEIKKKMHEVVYECFQNRDENTKSNKIYLDLLFLNNSLLIISKNEYEPVTFTLTSSSFIHVLIIANSGFRSPFSYFSNP